MINNVGTQSVGTFKSCISNKITLAANTARVILENNDNRMYVLVTNLSSSIITLQLGDITGIAVKKGINLFPYGSFEISQVNLYTGQISAISSANADITFVECVK